MRIVFDYQTFSIRQYIGISRYFVELATALSRMDDLDVHVVSPLIASRFLAERRNAIRAWGFDVSRWQRLPLRVVRRANRLLSPLASALARPDIVHETFYEPRQRTHRGAGIVTTMHDTIPEQLPQFFQDVSRYRSWVSEALQRADRVICVSESTRRDLLKLYPVNPAHVRVVHLGSSIEPVSELPPNEPEPFFLHVGARYPYKNFGTLVRAFGISGLWRTHRLIAFSSEAFTHAELEQIDRAGIPRNRVRSVCGDDAHLARYYAGATALLLPSLLEGFGIPVVEAMRCGCAVIASGTSSLPEVGGDAALYCDPQDPESFAVAMLRVAQDDALRKNMAARGRIRAAFFSWEKCARETHAVYRELLDS